VWVPDRFGSDKLTQLKPPQSMRASAIYLGWSLHLLHDLSHPYHAANRSGDKHKQSEAELDRWIKEGKFEDLPRFDAPGFAGRPTKAKYTWSDEQVYRPTMWADLVNKDYQDWSNQQVIHRYRECVNAAKGHYGDIRRSSERRRLAAYEQLLDMALKNTIMMIASINAPGGSERQPSIEPPPVGGGGGVHADKPPYHVK
jgi:hypothetical protein